MMLTCIFVINISAECGEQHATKCFVETPTPIEQNTKNDKKEIDFNLIFLNLKRLIFTRII